LKIKIKEGIRAKENGKDEERKRENGGLCPRICSPIAVGGKNLFVTVVFCSECVWLYPR